MNIDEPRSLKEQLGRRIAELRQLSGKTLEEFGTALDISAHSASQIEKGVVFPKWERLEPMAMFLRVEVKDLFDLSGERKLPPPLPRTRNSRRVVRRPEKLLRLKRPNRA